VDATDVGFGVVTGAVEVVDGGMTGIGEADGPVVGFGVIGMGEAGNGLSVLIDMGEAGDGSVVCGVTGIGEAKGVGFGLALGSDASMVMMVVLAVSRFARLLLAVSVWPPARGCSRGPRDPKDQQWAQSNSGNRS